MQFGTAYEDSLTAELTLSGGPCSAPSGYCAGKGLATTNFFETGAFLRTRDDVTHPNMQFEFLPLTRNCSAASWSPSPASSSGWTCARPDSRGARHLQLRRPGRTTRRWCSTTCRSGRTCRTWSTASELAREA